MPFRHLLAMLIVTGLTQSPLTAADGVFDSNGVMIRYVTEGTGVPVVLIHGWMSDSGMWGRDKDGNTKLNTDDTKGFQVIALDCRGHGKSDKPHDAKKYGAEMAADVVRLLDHLKLKKAHLIGYSSGAYIAGKVAATHPGRVLSVIYGGQAPIIATEKKESDFSECDLFAKLVDEGKDLGEYIREVTPAGKPKPSEARAKAYAKFLFDGKDVKAFAAAGRGFKDLEVTGDQLKECKAPTLFLHGGNESEHVKSKVAMVHKLLGRGDVKIIDGADHMTTLINPEFAATIIEFLRNGKVK